MTGHDLVRLRGVAKGYRRGTTRSSVRSALPGGLGERSRQLDHEVLRDIDLTVRSNERLGVIGPNGAGKSTLLKLIAGVIAPTRGTVGTRGRIASLIELGIGFHPDLSGRDNVYFTAALLGMTRPEIRQKYDEIVAFAEIEDAMDTPVKRYSSGMLARLGFAVASHVDADILLVDEVLAVGDIDFQRKSFERIRALGERGAAIVFVSHDMWTMAQICDRVVRLDHGAAADDGPATAVIERYAGPGTAAGGVWGRSPVEITEFEVTPADLNPEQGFAIDATVRIHRAVSDARVEFRLTTAEHHPFLRVDIPLAEDTVTATGVLHISGRVPRLPRLRPGPYGVQLVVIEGTTDLAVLSRRTAGVRIHGEASGRGELQLDVDWDIRVDRG